MLIRGISIAGIAIVVLLLGYGYLKLNVLTLREPVEEVNGVKITTGEWQERVKLQRLQLINYYQQYSFYQQTFGMDYSQQLQQIAGMMQDSQTLGQQVLDQMRDDILIRQEAAKRGITVSKAEVDKSIQESLSFFPGGTPTPTVTPTELVTPTLSSEQLTIYPHTPTATEAPTSTVTPTLTPDLSATPELTSTPAPATPTAVPELPTETATPYTEAGYKTEFDKAMKNYQTSGISEKTVRSVYEAQLLRQKFQDVLAKDLPHTEIQVFVRHILVDNDVAAATIEERLKRGEDFAKLAAEFSKDTGSATKGGVYEWAPASNYVEEFKNAVLTQKIGVIGEPVKTTYGYHIIQVIGREELPISDSQFEQKKQTALEDWLTTARKDAKVTIHDIWTQRVPTEPTLPAQ
jgi:peptidyl-prolyl cis-trans isomerase D